MASVVGPPPGGAGAAREELAGLSRVHCHGGPGVGLVATPQRRPFPKSFAWADASFSDDSCAEEDEGPVPPLRDDSYREGPLASLEDSRGGLNAKLRDVVGVDGSLPLDFDFLTGRSPSRPSQGSEACGYGVDVATPPRNAWQPNLDAPEFVPAAGPPTPQADEAAPTPSTKSHAARVVLDLEEMLTPEKKGTPGSAPGSAPSSCAGETHQRRREPGRKRRPPALQVPFQKRTKSEERETPAGAERRMRQTAAARAAQAGARCQAPVEAALAPHPRGSPTAALPLGQLPEASEEEWQHRVQTRRKAVAACKASLEYQWCEGARLRGECDGDGLRTPDPTDRTTSKRSWKYKMQQWRSELKQRFLLAGSDDDLEEALQQRFLLADSSLTAQPSDYAASSMSSGFHP